MNQHSVKENIEKEFELERLILFSDAVFAIAITLLIIEIKFPEIPENRVGVNMMKLFRPTIVQFLAFVLSFFFIGNLWSRHLKLCRLMVNYDDGVIRRNLFFLFFIVTFPFTASGITEHIKPGFMIPVFIYLGNIALVSLANYWLCNYVFYKKTSLSKGGHPAEKKYMLLQSKYLFLVMFIINVAFILTSIYSPEKTEYAFYVVPFVVLAMRLRLKKYRKAMKQEWITSE